MGGSEVGRERGREGEREEEGRRREGGRDGKSKAYLSKTQTKGLTGITYRKPYIRKVPAALIPMMMTAAMICAKSRSPQF